MKETLIEIFNPTTKSLSLNDIKKELNLQNISKNEEKELIKNLENLELDGKVYYDHVQNRYNTFPSNFFITTIKKNNDGIISFCIGGTIYTIKTNYKEISKKTPIIVKKDGENYNLVKVINKSWPNEIKYISNLEDLFCIDNKSFTLNELKKMVSCDNNIEVQNVLKELENEGLVYFDDYANIYKRFPRNYFVATAEVSKKGHYHIKVNNHTFFLSYNDSNGLLPFDKAIFEIKDENIEVLKIIKRANPEVICEVTEKNGLKVVGNNNIKIRSREKELKELSLPIGTRVLASISTSETNKVFDAHFIEVLGHKNDLDADLEAIAYNNGFKTRYTEEELNQVYSLPTSISEEDKINRTDLTQDIIFTIDGEHTKDMDDAVGIKKLDNGNYELTVSIAAVSHYIKYKSPLWERASYNTTSLYMLDGVSHMLHPQVSNGICSLNPNVERLAKTYKMIINPKGKVIDFEILDAVIKSRKKMTYEDVNKILVENTVPEGYEEFLNDINQMYDLSQIIENRRTKNGALNFDSKEITFVLDDNKNILDVKTRRQGPAEQIIENFMIITNESVAEYMLNIGIGFVYRNHEIPFDDKLKNTLSLIKTLGYRIELLKNVEDPRVLQKIIQTLSTKEEFFILSSLLLQSMQRAYFSTENHGHYGLALNAYSQTTSPIRRLMDLVIEYILDNLDKFYDPDFNMKKFEKELKELCERASTMERCADKAEYEANRLYMINYIIKHKDEEFIGYVQEITPKYLVVKTKDLIEGIVYFEDIEDGKYFYNPNNKWLENRKTKENIIIGSKLSLTLSDYDKEHLLIYFNASKENLKNTTLNRKKASY